MENLFAVGAQRALEALDYKHVCTRECSDMCPERLFTEKWVEETDAELNEVKTELGAYDAVDTMIKRSLDKVSEYSRIKRAFDFPEFSQGAISDWNNVRLFWFRSFGLIQNDTSYNVKDLTSRLFEFLQVKDVPFSVFHGVIAATIGQAPDEPVTSRTFCFYTCKFGKLSELFENAKACCVIDASEQVMTAPWFLADMTTTREDGENAICLRRNFVLRPSAKMENPPLTLTRFDESAKKFFHFQIRLTDSNYYFVEEPDFKYPNLRDLALTILSRFLDSEPLSCYHRKAALCYCAHPTRCTQATFLSFTARVAFGRFGTRA